MRRIVIEQLKDQSYRIKQGNIIYESIERDEVPTLIEKLLTNFDEKYLYEVFLNHNHSPIREKYGWVVRAISEEDVVRKFDTNLSEIKSIRKLTDDMPTKLYQITYRQLDEKKKIVAGRTPSEALYWFKNYKSGIYTIKNVEEIKR